MNGETQLFIGACELEYTSLARELVRKDSFDINDYDERRWSPLMWASAVGDLETVQILLDKGSDVNHVALGGRTPLSMAALNHNEEVVRLLVSKGANINFVDDAGMTILALCISVWGQRPILDTLKELGAHK